MAKKVYKSTRKYQCPFCEKKLPRMDLIDHVERQHNALIPEDYTPARVVYDSINKTDHGTCMICKKPVYEWNAKVSRYNNLCGSPKCKEEVRRIALERHIRVYNKPTLLDDAEHQEKMLSKRHISGKYRYSDGTVFTYTGKYEKAAIEFMDQVMNIPSKDIQMPGPILDYEYNGEKHSWITDIYYIPANLIIEVKDGGNNPNKRDMPEYRGKQKAKEIMITNLGRFNYLRLTNNDFSQLLEALAEIKYENMDQKENPRVNSFIHEEVGGLPPRNRSASTFIIPYNVNKAFDIAIGNDIADTVLIKNKDDEFQTVGIKDFFDKYNPGEMMVYHEEDSLDKFNYLIEQSKTIKSIHEAIEYLIGRKFRIYEELCLVDEINYIDCNEQRLVSDLIYNGVIRENEILTGKVKMFDTDTVLKGSVILSKSTDGYFIHTPNDYYLSSNMYDTVENIPQNVIDTMADLYDQYKARKEKGIV